MKLPRTVHILASPRHGVWIAQGIEIALVVQGESSESVAQAMVDAMNSYTTAMQELESSGDTVDPIPPLRWKTLWLAYWWVGFAVQRLLRTEPLGYKKLPTRPLAHA